MSKLNYPCREGAGTKSEIAEYRRCFASEYYILLKNFVSPELLAMILPMIETAGFETENYEDVGSEFRMVSNLAQEALSLLSNHRRLLDFVQEVSGCVLVNCFRGRVYKLVADPKHTFEWHSDLNDGSRRVTMSINLSRGGYQGGELQIRETNSGKVLAEIANTGLGDAVLFPISAELEHRVLPVRGNRARIAFSGWFRAETGVSAPLPWLPPRSIEQRGSQ